MIPPTRTDRLFAAVLIALSTGTAAVLAAMLAVAIFVAPEDPAIPRPLHLSIAAITGATAVLFSLVGSIIEWRRAGHAVGRVMLLAGPLYAAMSLLWLADTAIDASVGADTMVVVDWAKPVVSYPGLIVVAALLPALFPSGRLPGRRWRVATAALLVPFAVGVVAFATRPGPLLEGEADNPFGVAGWPDALQPLIGSLELLMVALIGVAVAVVVVRYRRGDHVERLQVRWLLASVGIVAAGFVGIVIELSLRPPGETFLYMELVAFSGILAMPVAIGVAIFRHHLYDIDRIISRTIGWALVTGLLVAIFGALVVGLQAVLVDVTQGETLAVAASTLVAFALFQPIRRRVQRAVDRRFDRARYDGERMAADFAERLRDDVDLDTIAAAFEQTASQAVRPTAAMIWLPARRSR